jgi:LysM repeat protein
MKNPPTWAKQLKNKKVRGVHTFGYLLTNDPKYTDMSTMLPINKTNTLANKTTTTKTYVVKKGDTIWKIAKDNMISAKQLMLNNNITDPSKI